MPRSAGRPDHMDIGVCFILLAIVAGLVGSALSLCLRLPAQTVLDHAGLEAGSLPWHALAPQHGPIMVFLSAIPALIGGFGNWFVPLQIGARDTAFPRLATVSFCLTAAGFVLILGGLPTGAPAMLLPVALHVTGIAIVLCSANLVATMLNLRAPGMSLAAMPLFSWSQMIAGCLVVVSVPMLMAASTAAALTGVPPMQPLQHLFRVFGYPGFCIMILPAFGLVSEIVSSLGGRALVGRRSMIGAMATLAVAGFLAWAHQLLHGGIAGFVAARSLPTLAVVLPVLAMAGCWIATLWRAPTTALLLARTPGLFAVGCIAVLLVGSLAALASPVPGGRDLVPAQLHDMLSLGAVFAMFAGYYYWIGKMTGKPYPEQLGRLQFWSMFIGVDLSALPSAPAATVGAVLTGLSILLFALIVVVTLTRRRSVPANPWGAGAATLEWSLPSPALHGALRA